MNDIKQDNKTHHYCKCKKCNESFVYESDDIFWDEKGMGYSAKLTKCKHCGCINVIKYIEDYGFGIMNTDYRLYDYSRD